VTRTRSGASAATGQRAVRGVAVLFAVSTWAKFQGMFVQLALAYLLSQEDFGKVGLCYTISTFANRIVNPGTSTVLMQRTHRLRLWATPVFWLSLTSGLCGAALMLLAAPIAADIYDVPEVVSLVAVLALAAPIGSLQQVPGAMLNADLRFGFLARTTLLVGLLSGLLTVTFAALGFGPYCFVLPLPIANAVQTALYWFAARPQIRLRLHVRKWRFFLDRSIWVFIYLLCVTAIGQGDYIVLGTLFDAAVVGTYFFGFNLAMQSAAFVGHNVQSVLYPTLVSLGQEASRQRRAVLEASHLLGLVLGHLCTLQAVLAAPMLRLLFGERWVGAVPIVQLLSLGVGFEWIAVPAVQLLLARGRFRTVAAMYGGATLVFFALVYPGAYFGREVGAAFSVTCYYVVVWLPLYGSIMRRAGASLRQALWPYFSTVLGNGLAALCGLTVSHFVARSDLERALVLVLVLPPTYLLIMRLIAPRACEAAWQRLRQLRRPLPPGKGDQAAA